MTPKPKISPRKQPLQARAQATVEALLAATARILVRDGYDRASTNRVAELAGVSIGSLYQYFPSKEAIVSELVEQVFAEELRVLDSVLAVSEGQPLAQVIRALLEAMLALHAINPKLRRILIEQVPRIGRLERQLDVETQIAQRIRERLAARASELRPGVDLDMAAFVLVHAVESVIHGAIFKRPEYLNGDQDEKLLNELCHLVSRYLSG